MRGAWRARPLYRVVMLLLLLSLGLLTACGGSAGMMAGGSGQSAATPAGKHTSHPDAANTHANATGAGASQRHASGPSTPAPGSLQWAIGRYGPFSTKAVVVNGTIYVGTSSYYMLAIDASSGKVLWSYLNDNNVSNPVVVNGTVYFTSCDASVYALNAGSGAVVWSYQTGQCIEQPPAVANGVVYVGSDDDLVYALNAGNGSVLWLYQTRGNVVAAPTPSGSYVYAVSQDDNVYALNASSGTLAWQFLEPSAGEPWSPVVANNLVYVANDGQNLYALNATTGATVWHYQTSSTSAYFYWAPLVAGSAVYVQYSSLTALNASTGAVLWTGGVGSSVAQPVVSGTTIYVANYSLYAVSTSDGSLLWTFAPTGGAVSNTPQVVGSTVYAAGGNSYGSAYAVNAANGAMFWQYQAPNNVYNVYNFTATSSGVYLVGGNTLSDLDTGTGTALWQYDSADQFNYPPVIANGVAYGSYGSEVLAVNATTGLLLWAAEPGGSSMSNVAADNGLVFVGSSNYSLYALNSGTGAIVWQYQTGNYVVQAPVTANGVVYFDSYDGSVYAFGESAGTYLWRTRVAPVNSGSGPGPLTLANGDVYTQGYSTSSTSIQMEYALSQSNGTVLWTYTPGSGNSISDPVVSGNQVFLEDSRTEVTALNATNGAVEWSDTNAYFYYPFSVGNGVLAGEGYINGSNGYNVFALSAGNGALLWNNTDGVNYESEVVIADDEVLTASQGTLYALSVRSGDVLWSNTPNCSLGVCNWRLGSASAVSGALYAVFQPGGTGDPSGLLAINVYTGATLWNSPGNLYGSYGSFPPIVSNGMVYASVDGFLALTASPPIAPPPPQGPTGSERLGSSNPAELGYCRECAGDPIDTYSGNFSHTFADLTVPGRGIALSFSHTYNAAAAGVNGSLGWGWTDSYAWSLAVDGTTGNVTITQENGSTVGFAPDGHGGYTAANRVLGTLTKNADGSFTYLRLTDQTRFSFNSSGQLTAELDRNNYTTTLSYDATTHQLTTVTDPAGRTLSFTYDGSGRISGVTDPAGRTLSFSYDTSGNLATYTDVAGGVTSFTYDSNHLLLTMKAPNGGVTTNVYDGSGRVTSQTDPMGRTTSFSYVSGANGASATTVTDPLGNQAVESYQNGLLMSKTLGYGTAQAATWSYTYDPLTLGIATITDPNNHVTTETWDVNGNLQSKTDPLGRTTTYTYDGLNDLVSTTDAAGVTTSSIYDTHGNLLSTSTPLGGGSSQVRTTSYTYGDSAHPGDVTASTDPDGRTTTYAYDAQGDRVSTTDPLGETTSATFNVLGERTAQTSPLGEQTTYTYDAFGDLTATTDPLGHTTTTTYDALRNPVTVTDPDGHVTTTSYDLDSELVTVTRADGTTLHYAYNADGDQTSQTDALGHTTTYAYDPFNRLTALTDPLGRKTTYTYDAAGNRTAITSADHLVTSYSYDIANQLMGVAYSDGTTPGVSYTYDVDGRRHTMTDGTGTTDYAYDALGRLTSQTNGAGQTVGYAYDLAGQLTGLTYPTNRSVTRGYDAAGRLVSVTDWLGHTSRFRYDADGQLAGIGFGNGTAQGLAYDAAGHLTALAIGPTSKAGQLHPPAPYLHLTYSYDAAGLLTSLTPVGSGTTNPGQQPESYAYTALDQVSADSGVPYAYDAADEPTQAGAASLSYDAAGELTAQTSGATGATSSVSYRYDARGNRTQATPTSGTSSTYTYDQANRLVSYTSGSTTASYAYDGDGLRMQKTVNGTRTAYTWDVSGLESPDGLPQLLMAGNSAFLYGPQGQVLEQITPATQQAAPTAGNSASSQATVRYLAHDGLGSTRALTDAAGHLLATYTYDAYGDVTTHTPSGGTVASGGTYQPFLFAGQYRDAESGLYNLRARLYDPATGQFLTRDPLAPLTRQLYVYAGDDPLNASDPSGLFGWSWGAAADAFAIAAGVGAIALTIATGGTDLVIGLGISAGALTIAGGISGIIGGAQQDQENQYLQQQINQLQDSNGNQGQGTGGYSLQSGPPQTCPLLLQGGSVSIQGGPAPY